MSVSSIGLDNSLALEGLHLISLQVLYIGSGKYCHSCIVICSSCAMFILGCTLFVNYLFQLVPNVFNRVLGLGMLLASQSHLYCAVQSSFVQPLQCVPQPMAALWAAVSFCLTTSHLTLRLRWCRHHLTTWSLILCPPGGFAFCSRTFTSLAVVNWLCRALMLKKVHSASHVFYPYITCLICTSLSNSGLCAQSHCNCSFTSAFLNLPHCC